MPCPYCQNPNPAQARFCMQCGQSLINALVCLRCSTILPLNARYCYHCGDLATARQLGAPIGYQPNAFPPVQAMPQPPLPPGPVGPPLPQPQQPVYPQQYTQPPQNYAQPQAGYAQPPTSYPPPTTNGAHVTQTAQMPQIMPAAQAQTSALTGQVVGLGLPVPRPLQEMLTSLKDYLPPAIYEPMERRPNERQLTQVRDHLTALLKSVKTYLPTPVYTAPQPPGEPAGGMFRGVFLFVDVSGFTPLSEQLRKFGKLGAERITSIINDLFSEVVTILFDHGGTLIKFGGDALLGLFPAVNDDEMVMGALHATQAAVAMQAVMSKFAAIEAAGETRSLRIKCGISSGPYFAAHIGTKQNMVYVTTGHTVNRAEQAEGHASPGEIVITQQTYDMVKDKVQVELRDAGFYLVTGAPPTEGNYRSYHIDEPPPGELMAQITYLVDRMDRLSPYLPGELISRIVNNPVDARISPDHRPVTVIFANYVGISDLIDDLGDSEPEIITYQLNKYFVEMAEVVERYEGTVARMDQYKEGDRLVVFFGAPNAHEDDPVRAVYTALELQKAVRENFAALKSSKGVYRFRQRIGINTGHLFAGNVGAANLRQEYTLMGDDINMAARLMSNAPFDKILISKKTKDRVEALVEVKDWGELKVKGKDILIPTFEVLGRRAELGAASGEKPEAPLVGRDDMMTTLEGAVRAVMGGRGQIVSVIGDGGLGKSRMMRDIKRWLSAQDQLKNVNWVEAQGLSFSEQISYGLVAQLLRVALELKSDASKDDLLYALWERSEELLGKENAREVTPFLAYIMGLELEGDWARLVNDLDPQVRQKQIFWAAREFFTAKARSKPTIMVIDDLHWADEASLSMLENLIEISVHAPIMFVFMFRPKRDKGCWRLRGKAEGSFHHRYTELELDSLDDKQTIVLMENLLPGAKFSTRVKQVILEKSAGNPFYVAEIARSLIDNETVRAVDNGRWEMDDSIDDIAIPDTLQGAIMARIDRLTEDARQALQMASVIGRRFQLEVMQHLAETKFEVETWLSQLEQNNLILPAAVSSHRFYEFLDALVQEVAYDNLLTERKQVFHRGVGETLEQMLAGQLEQECELLAYHFRNSDDHVKAIKYLEMAGRKAQAEFANETALHDFTDLLTLLPNDEANWQRRYDVLSARQKVYGLLGMQEARDTDLQEMLRLAISHRDESRRSDVLNGMADMFQWTGRYDRAESLAKEALELKTRLNDPAGRAVALHQLGVLEYIRGNYENAVTPLAQAVELRRDLGDHEGEAWSEMYLGMIDYAHGHYAEAVMHHEFAKGLAEARQDMFQVGIHMTNLARVYLRLGDYEQALEQFQRSFEMKKRVGDRIGQGFNLYNIGLSYYSLGNLEEARLAFEQSLELRREINDERGIGYSLHGLGLAALSEEQFEKAGEYFTQAYAIALQLGLRAETITYQSYLGQAHLALGQLEEARAASDAACLLLLEQVDVQEEQQIYLNHFRVLAAQEDPRASEYLQLAYDEILKQANQITDLDQRQHFLRASTINQEIIAEVARGIWGVEMR